MAKQNLFFFQILLKQYFTRIFLFLFIIFLPVFTQLSAQVDSPPYQPPGTATRPPLDTFTYDVGINKYNSDVFLYLNPKFNMDFDNKWGFSLQVPVNLLVYDKEPKYTNSSPGMVRPGDYNTREDYQKIINYVWYGNYGVYTPGKISGSIYAGKMFDGYIGHGTIINRYINNQRVDYYKIGVMADVNTDYGGVQVFTNSVSDKEVNAGRGYIRPYGIIMGIVNLFTGGGNTAYLMPGNVLDEVGRKKVKEEAEEEEKTIIVEKDPETGKLIEVEKSAPKKRDMSNEDPPHPMNTIWNRFSIGYTSAFDGKAPYELSFDTTGSLKYTKDNQPDIKRSRRLGIEGYDAEFKIINWDWLELTPYFDYNRIRHLNNSYGRHYGVIFKIGNRKINFTLRPELRKMSANYIPMYFDSFYEIERYQTNLDTNFPTTKYEYIDKIDPTLPEKKGFYHTAILNINSWGFEVNFENYDGKNNSRIFIGTYIPVTTFLRISGYYIKKGFDKNKEAFKVDDRSQGVAEIALTLGPIVAKLQNRRRWIYDSELNSYKAKDEQFILFSGGKSF